MKGERREGFEGIKGERSLGTFHLHGRVLMFGRGEKDGTIRYGEGEKRRK